MTEAANPARPESSSVSANVEAQGMRPKQSQHLSMHLQHPPSPSVEEEEEEEEEVEEEEAKGIWNSVRDR